MFNFAKKANSQSQATEVQETGSVEIQSLVNEPSEGLEDAKLQALTDENGDLPESEDKPPQPKKKHWLWWLVVGMLLGSGSAAFVLYRGWQELEALVPGDVDEVLIYTRPDTMVVKAADGTVIEEVGPVSHDKVKIWAVPEMVSQAFISSEDRRFYDHFGVDTQGIFRAAIANFKAGEVVEGGSSITQQVARVVFLTQEKSALRKVKEMRLATKLEEKFTKEQILESYLNLVYLGSGAYGVADAAWVYFGKTVDELTLPETAMIAGLAPAPSLYSPFVNPDLAITRRNQVLQRMWEDEFISKAARDQAIATPLEMNRNVPKRLLRKYPYFSDYIQAELEQYLTPEQLDAGGVVVETTIDPKWQDWAEAVIADGIEQYGLYQGFKQAALVSIDPRNGQIKTMVGGTDYENNQFNRVTQAQRQPGSTFKTFVYTAAIASGMAPSKTYVDREFAVDGYKPKNYSGTYSNQAISLTEALTKSVNTIALNVMLDVGWDPIISLAKRMGIKSEMKPTYSLALGSWEVNLLEITSAYGTLANKGAHQPNYGISRIFDRDGKVIYQAALKPVQSVDASTAAIMTSMLTNVVSSGTGRQANIGRSVAGKTGTSDKAKDLWFIGFIPQMVTGIWLGNDNSEATWGASSTAARLWGNLMKQITTSMEVEDFPEVSDLKNRVGSIKADPLRGGKRRRVQNNTSENTQAGESTTTRTRRSTSPVIDNEAIPRAEPRNNTKPRRTSTYDRSPSYQPVPATSPTRSTTPSRNTGSNTRSTTPSRNTGSSTRSTTPSRNNNISPPPDVPPVSNPTTSAESTTPPPTNVTNVEPASQPSPPVVAPPANVDIPAPPVIQKKEPAPEAPQ